MQLQKQELLSFRWEQEMFVAKFSLPGKNNSNPTQLQRQSLLWSCIKDDSTTTLNPLPMKITQKTQIFRKNIGKLKGTTLF